LFPEPERDRRLQKRYPIDLPLDYKLKRLGAVLGTGSGRTLNLASHGVLIETGSLVAFPLGSAIELAIDWPMLLDGECRLKLVMRGCIVRLAGRCVAIQANQYEFRTRRHEPARMLEAVSA
jgi:hypothetical protein